jgi:hypothetical protein
MRTTNVEQAAGSHHVRYGVEKLLEVSRANRPQSPLSGCFIDPLATIDCYGETAAEEP